MAYEEVLMDVFKAILRDRDDFLPMEAAKEAVGEPA